MKRHQFYKTRKSQIPTDEQAEKNEDYKKNMNSPEERNHNIEKNYGLKINIKNENNTNEKLAQEKVINKNKEINNNSDKSEEKIFQSKKNYEEMDDLFNEVEKFNAKNILKGDLAEMYDDINKNNYFFKNNVFLANVDHFDKNTGILDNKPIIPYNYSHDISYKLDSYPRTNEIIEKFTEKTKTFSQYA